MVFKEPLPYFQHFQDQAVHLLSGKTITGYLNLDPVDVDAGGFSPTVSSEVSPEFECIRTEWEAAEVRTGDLLLIRNLEWVVEEQPRRQTIGRVKLRRNRDG